MKPSAALSGLSYERLTYVIHCSHLHVLHTGIGPPSA